MNHWVKHELIPASAIKKGTTHIDVFDQTTDTQIQKKRNNEMKNGITEWKIKTTKLSAIESRNQRMGKKT